MSRLSDVGDAHQWRCWICDEAVDPDMSVNDPRGPSIDNITTRSKSKGKTFSAGQERLAHRGCNTGRGATAPVVPWPDDLFIVDPAPLIGTAERLLRKGGREAMGRCPTREDADAVAEWLVDRMSRLAPELAVTADIEPGGGQYLVILRA